LKKADREQRERSTITIQIPPQVDAVEFREVVERVAGYMGRGDHVLVFNAPPDITEASITRSMQQFASAVRRGRPVITVEVPAGMEPEIAQARITAALPRR